MKIMKLDAFLRIGVLVPLLFQSCATMESPTLETTSQKEARIRVVSSDFIETWNFFFEGNTLKEISVETRWSFPVGDNGQLDTGSWNLPQEVARAFVTQELIRPVYEGDKLSEIFFIPQKNNYVDQGETSHVVGIRFGTLAVEMAYRDVDGRVGKQVAVPYGRDFVTEVKRMKRQAGKLNFNFVYRKAGNGLGLDLVVQKGRGAKSLKMETEKTGSDSKAIRFFDDFGEVMSLSIENFSGKENFLIDEKLGTWN